MKRILLTLILFYSACQLSFGQNGDEWINFSQTYYKIKTAQDGIYRITYADMQAAGIPVANIDPRRLQLFHRGQEQAIEVVTASADQLASGDYFQFLGKINDGTLDEALYPSAAAHTLPDYSLFADSTAYFLTWSTSTNGKRIPTQPANNITGLTDLTYHMAEVKQILNVNFSAGRIYPEGLSATSRLSGYDEASGWTGAQIRKGQSVNYTLSGITNPVTTGPVPTLEMTLVGRNNQPHNVEIRVGPDVNNLRLVRTVNFEFQRFVNFSDDLQWTDISTTNNSMIVQVTVVGFPEIATDLVSVSKIEFRFAQATNQANLAAKRYESQTNANGFYRFTNSGPNYSVLDITDENNITRLQGQVSGTAINIALTAGAQPRKLLLNRNDNVITGAPIKRARMKDINNSNANYLIIAHQSLHASALNYVDPVRAYAGYRASTAGGGFDTLTMDMDQLYDQFSFGEETPLAIYRFLRKMYNQSRPDYLLLLGKGVAVTTTGSRNVRNGATLRYPNLIPPAGFPSNDDFFSVGLDPTQPNNAAIMTGRVPAKNPTEVANYLNKMREKETQGLIGLWQKDFVQLSGGLTAAELTRYSRYTDDFKAVAEDLYLGARVTILRKRSNSSVELINISNEVNNGLNHVTFFGHAAATIVDIEIGYVSDDTYGYRNKGKYPVLFVNGCDAGNGFAPGVISFGEDWIVTGDRGAANFIAHSDIGIDVVLKRWADIYYATAFADSSYVYRSIGEIKKEVNRRFLEQNSPTAVNLAQVQQNMLLGDPFSKPFGAKKVDYAIDEGSLFLESYDGSTINSLTDSLRLGVIVKNIGIVEEKPFNIHVNRVLSDGSQFAYTSPEIDPIRYRDTVYINLPNSELGAFGENFFNVTLNRERTIEEENYNNNSQVLSRFIPLSGSINLQPLNYGIVDSVGVRLLAQTPAYFAAERSFTFEIDTASTFNSPNKKTQTVVSSTTAAWDVNLFDRIPQRDSVTFYWRTKFADPRPNEDTAWVNSSFTYIGGSEEGWTQASFPQFRGSFVEGFEQNMLTRQWEFEKTRTEVSVFNFGDQTPGLTNRNVQVTINGLPYILDNVNNLNSRLCPNNTVAAVAFDHNTTAPYLVILPPGFDVLFPRSCGRTPQVINNFLKANIEGADRLLNQYIDGVAADDYVLMFSIGTVTYESWPADVLAKMQEIGASQTDIQGLTNGEPFILLGRKGAPAGSAIFIKADASSTTAPRSQELTYNTSVTGLLDSGFILSPNVGPSSEWISFFKRATAPENFIEGEVRFDIIGVDTQGNTNILFPNVNADNVDLSSVSAAQYPFLRLRYEVANADTDEAPQLKKLQVLYEGVPEGVAKILSEESNFVVVEGQDVNIRFGFENISGRDFQDSITVRYTLRNTAEQINREETFKIAAVRARQSTEFDLTFNSQGLKGKTDLLVFVNPREQKEQTFINNVIEIQDFIEVSFDDTNPILDVAFDGRYILDGDIIQASPLITVSLKDENEFLLKRDTLGVEIQLKQNCEGCDFRRINFSDPRVRWYEATNESDFRVEYQPDPLEDGIYTLQVNASDASGNTAGTRPYSINFEVVNEASITNFYPYPNPFSTSVRFVFTVTGAQIPDQIKIQIMTVTGKVVKEILQDELGPIRIGNNISDYAWDGRDEFGDQLANGVYLYRVIVRSNGQELERRASAGDRGFKQGYGKLYLLR